MIIYKIIFADHGRFGRLFPNAIFHFPSNVHVHRTMNVMEKHYSLGVLITYIYVKTSMWIVDIPQKPKLKYPKLVNWYLLTVPYVYSESDSAEHINK